MRNALENLENRRLMATFTVTSSADSGAGSLRDAITQANATTAADVVNFNINGGGSYVIPTQATYAITQPLTIDATTQPGYSGTPVIRLSDNNNVLTGMVINAANTIVRGLAVTGFGAPSVLGDGTGIYVNAPDVTIEKNWIGMRGGGVVEANEGDGILISSLGAYAHISDNTISGNGGDGVEVQSDHVRLTGNIIGLDPTGSFARPNTLNGIRIQQGEDALIGSGGGQTNVISANGQAGVLVEPTAGPIRVFNTYFGLSKSGNGIMANGGYGLWINGPSHNFIGNLGVGSRFGGNGIRITSGSEGNTIQYNTFGIGVNPTFDVGSSVGINVEDGHATIENNTLGRLDTAIRYVGNVGVIQSNFVGITENGVAIPNQLGITINGDFNDVQYNKVANNSLYGEWVIGGEANFVRDSAWNNGQSVSISAGANGDLPKPDISPITTNADGSFTANVGAVFTKAGTYRFNFFVSDGAGHPNSGDTQQWVRSIDRFMNVGGQGFDTTFTSGLLDGQYLTAQVVEIGQNNTNRTSGEPSPGVKATGRPAVYSSQFEFETGHAWKFRFSADVGASLQPSDLEIRNALNVQYSATSVTWDPSTNTARWARSTPLPDAFYTVSIKTGSVASANGTNTGNFPMTFRVIRGDANNDDVVDFDDLLIVAQNYGKTGRTWSTGDFDYNGTVNFDDLLFVAQRFTASAFSTVTIGASASHPKTAARELLA